MAEKKTINELIMEYFKDHPNMDLKHGPVVDYVTQEYLKFSAEPPRDPWRAIRSLHQNGYLIKVKKGVYRYDPNYKEQVDLWDFDEETKAKILERDNYRCVVCGRGEEDGVELTVDHKKPKNSGGDNSIDNGQTLCSPHNILKKKYSRTEAGKKYIIQLYEDALRERDVAMINFCEDLFEVFDKHHIDEHIKVSKKKSFI
ncbi:MAG: HNH endonuclease [Chloroflexi bacterium]|nr:HNH endonuclease [Chloroflexota bacterium]